MVDQLNRNKQNAVAFYELMFNECRPAEAVERYVVTSTFNTILGWEMGRTGLSSTSFAWRTSIPGKHVDIKRVIADGNYVVLHCFQLWPGDRNWAGMDIFRFDENGKIVEHWDVLQVIPETSANGNTMF